MLSVYGIILPQSGVICSEFGVIWPESGIICTDSGIILLVPVSNWFYIASAWYHIVRIEFYDVSLRYHIARSGVIWSESAIFWSKSVIKLPVFGHLVNTWFNIANACYYKVNIWVKYSHFQISACFILGYIKKFPACNLEKYQSKWTMFNLFQLRIFIRIKRVEEHLVPI
jgi:hypothetical protein